MDILVILKMAPDVVEELEIDPGGTRLDLETTRMILSESDDHALEEALLLKERHGGKVTVLAIDAAEVDDALWTALAKGADRAIKVTGLDEPITTRAAAQVIGKTCQEGPGILPVDMILTGTQAIDDIDGLMAPLVSFHLGMPCLSILTAIRPDPGKRCATALREFASGIRGEFQITLPAVLGVQSAEKPPRYVPVAKVRAAMKTARIETVDAPALEEAAPLISVKTMRKPEVAGKAIMLEGPPEAVASELCGILAGRGLL